MSNREKRACSHFLRDGDPETILNSPDQYLIGYADRVLLAAQQDKRARFEKFKYRSAKHVTSENNICELLLSQVILITNFLRKCINPRTLKMLLMIKANKKL